MSVKPMNILAIGSHPDDIEFGCAGTLIKYSRRGHRLFLMIMTQGQEGGEGEIRKKEQYDSAEVMGVEDIFWGDYKDTRIPMSQEPILKIENVIRKVRPSFIFCHYHEDTHQDHRSLARATLSATRHIPNVLYYEGPSTHDFSPQVYVDISDTLELKMETLKRHESQVMKTNVEGLSILEFARSTANFRGIQGRVRYAEGFHAIRLFINT
ncbi:MAG: PIG-L deacetylase family protein [Desulfatibacillaceae bacterium]